MTMQILRTSYYSLVAWAERFTDSKYWLLKVALLSTLVTLFIAFPRYLFDIPRLNQTIFATSEWEAVEYKSRDLTFDLSTVDVSSGAERVNFRLTMPFIANLLNLQPWVLLFLQWMAGICLFALSAAIVYRINKDRVSALGITLALTGIYAGTTAFVETRARFDAVSLALLLLSIWTSAPYLIAPAIFIAAWNDERALIASSLVLVYHLLHQMRVKGAFWKAAFSVPISAIVIAWFLYFVSRTWYSSQFGIDIQIDPGIGPGTLLQQSNMIAMGTWVTYEGAWLLILLGIYSLIRLKQYVILFGYLAAMGLVIIIGLAVVDVSRSVAYALPGLFVALFALNETDTVSDQRRVIAFAAVICLIFPAYYVGGVSSIWFQYPFPAEVVRRLLGVEIE